MPRRHFTLSLQDPDHSLQDPDYSLQDPDHSLQDPDHSLQDPDYSLQDPDSPAEGRQAAVAAAFLRPLGARNDYGPCSLQGPFTGPGSPNSPWGPGPSRAAPSGRCREARRLENLRFKIPASKSQL